MPNFRSLARLEVQKSLCGVGWFAKSFSCQTQPLCCVEVRVRVGVLTIHDTGCLENMKSIETFFCGWKEVIHQIVLIQNGHT